jgi:hypothetical protein
VVLKWRIAHVLEDLWKNIVRFEEGRRKKEEGRRKEERRKKKRRRETYPLWPY